MLWRQDQLDDQGDPRGRARRAADERSQLLELLVNGSLTVPELAEAGGLPADEVMLWMMGLRRYGYVSVEKGGSDDGYYCYAAVGRA
jgi:predicted Rossmann fold nucleotide-binding protein DprA/Smf involved in DNA uptake